MFWGHSACPCSGWRSSLHDWAPRQRWRSVFQHQQQAGDHFQPGPRPWIRSELKENPNNNNNCVNLDTAVHQQISTCWVERDSRRLLFPQVSWSTVRSSEISRSHLMVSSTPTSAALPSSTRRWGWGWRSAHTTSPSFRTGSGSRCCGQRQRHSKEPSERLNYPVHLSSAWCSNGNF